MTPILVSDGSGALNVIVDSGTLTAVTSITNPVTVAQGTAANLNATVVGTGTFATQSAITAASGSIASGAVASGAFASGALASGSVASGAYASGSISAGAIAAGATSLVKLEDVASAGGDAGVPAMAIQTASPADTAAEGDYSMLQVSGGRLWTSTTVTGTVTVTATNLSTNLAQVNGVTSCGRY
jgi:hypothetical protein